MLEPINLPAMAEEYRSAVGPMLKRIETYDRMIATMVNSTEKNKLTKRRAMLWEEVLELQGDIRKMESHCVDFPVKVLPTGSTSGSDKIPKVG